jgi:endonuclease III
VKTARETREILDRLETQHPDADTQLGYSTPFELLTATILSAQSTDAGVNMVTPTLFARYPNAAALAKASSAELEPQIHSTGFFHSKAKSLLGMARALVEKHGGEVPNTMDALVELPGVGRKTANVVLGHALGVPGIPVDRHVLRVANRIGIADSDDPLVVEQELGAAMPRDRWTRASDTLILHGRRICRPRPMCNECVIVANCDYYALVVSRERSAPKSKVISRKAKAKPTKPKKTPDTAKPARRAARRVRKARR